MVSFEIRFSTKKCKSGVNNHFVLSSSLLQEVGRGGKTLSFSVYDTGEPGMFFVCLFVVVLYFFCAGVIRCLFASRFLYIVLILFL
jgi:hypothetical protein